MIQKSEEEFLSLCTYKEHLSWVVGQFYRGTGRDLMYKEHLIAKVVQKNCVYLFLVSSSGNKLRVIKTCSVSPPWVSDTRVPPRILRTCGVTFRPTSFNVHTVFFLTIKQKGKSGSSKLLA